VDEQHRFGVEQRLKLTEKGMAPHLLQMSATPIPRSLTMTVFGDMESSALVEKPAGRQAIDTRTIPLSRSDEVVDAVSRAIAAGQKLYWICPLIEQAEEESDFADMAAVEERFRVLKHRFGDAVAMMHGRMKSAEREAVMQEFAFGKTQMLVATTVVEVGVNVPEATIMIIEHAERFGLAQLHQLRGRVGRGLEASRCLLLYDPNCSELAKERLKTIRGSNDGFMIAEEDLRLRGAGDVLGTRQTGVPAFHFVNLLTHAPLLRTARDDAKHLLAQDPQLVSERGQACRLLLALFGYDEETASLRAA
jgi:ATP-dependent DNA helicase RecG